MSVVYLLGRFRACRRGQAFSNARFALFLTLLMSLGVQVAHAQVPAAPAGLTGIPGATHVNLYWNATATATSYTVYRATTSSGPWTTFTSAVTSYASTGITNATLYYYKVTATNASGEGTASTTISATPNTAPAAPVLGVTSISGATINLSWNAIAGATYNLYRSTTSGQQGIAPFVAGISGTTYADSGLTGGTAYYYTITAVVSGEESVQSAQVGGKPIPAPTSLTATPGNGSITLTWGAPTGALSYKIYRGTTSGGETVLISSMGGLSYTDSGLVNGTAYYYQVSGLASSTMSEGVKSSEAVATPQATLPAAPVLTAVPGSATVVLSWPAVASATSYKIKRATVMGGPYTVLSSPTSPTYTDTSPIANTTYFYVATALIGTTGGPNSNECAASVPSINSVAALADSDDRQDTPTTNYGWKNAITVLAQSARVRNTYLTFDLTGAFGLISSAKLKLYKATGASDTETVNGINPTSWSENTINWSNAPALTGTSIATLATTATGQYYSFDVTSYVQAQQLAGATAVSFGLSTTSTTEIDFYSRENGSNRPQLALTVGAPVAPTGLTATSGQTKKVTLNWSAVPGAASYSVYSGATAGGESATPIATGLTSPTYQHTGLADGTTYFYKVSATSANGEGAKSAEASGTTNAPPSITTAAAVSPSPVTGTTAALSVMASDDGGAGNLTYTWSSTGTPPAAVTFSGANGTTGGNSVTATFTKVGAYSFLVTVMDGGGLSTTGAVSATVNQTLTTVTVSPSTATVGLGGTQIYTASGLDQFGTALATQPSFAWTVSGGGTISATTGLFTAETSIGGGGTSDGPFTVTAASGGKSGTATVTVANAAPTVATAAAVSPSPVTGTTATLSVLGADDGGEASLTYTWVATTVPSGATPTFSANTSNAAKSVTVTFNKAGAYTFQATIKDAGGLTVTSSVSVTVNQTQTSIAVTPPTAALAHSATQTFTASAKDQFGVALTSQPTFTWSVDSGGVGGVNATTGLYSAGTTNGTAKVRATSGALSNYASVSVVSAVPSAPTGLTATGGAQQISLSWTASANTSYYNVYRGTSAGGESATAINASPVYGTTYVDTSLANGKQYYYKLKSVNGVGSSAYSSEASAITTLVPVSTLAAAPGGASVTLTWTAISGASSYSIYRGTTPGGESTTAIKTGQTTPSYTNTGLTNGQIYYYYVKVVYPGGTSAASNQASATPLAAPAAPTNIRAVSGAGRVILTWDASVNATSYNIYRGTTGYGNESATPIAIGVASTTYADAGLPNNGTRYYYRLKAVGVGGTSAYSLETSGMPNIGDAAEPMCVLLQSADGLFYGTTAYGGANSQGTIFKYDPVAQANTVIYSFPAVDANGDNVNGARPHAGLIQATDGYFYGSAYYGGAENLGTLFRVDANGNYTLLHSFTAAANDGANPSAEMVQAADGNLYGTTLASVFRYDPRTSTFTNLHTFASGSDGATCEAGLVESSGLLLGGTWLGGQYDNGVLFAVDEATGTYSVRMSLFDPAFVESGLTLGDDGYIYGLGTAPPSGRTGSFWNSTNQCYSIHSIVALADTPPDGNLPFGPLIEMPDQCFYGVTQYGGDYDMGTVFKITKAGVITYLHSFTGYKNGDPQNSDGQNPAHGLTLGKDGYLYGSTQLGGSNNDGCVYRISSLGNYTVLYSMDQPPAAPGGFTLTETSATCATVSWNAVPGATSYKIKRSSAPGGPFEQVNSTTSTSYQDCGLTPGQTYYFEVTAVIAAGESIPTLILSVTMSNLPGGPANLTATSGNTQVVLNWSAVSGVTSYSINRSTVSGGPYTSVGTTGSTTYTNTGLTNGTTYYYTVNGAAGVVTQNSNQAYATPSVPGPTNLQAVPGNAQVALTWGTIAGATSYNLKRSTINGGPYTTIASPTTTSYTNSPLTNGTTYYYVVSAVTASGETANSNQAAALPAAPSTPPSQLSAAPGNATVELDWDASAGVTTYHVWRSTTSGTGYVNVATVNTVPSVYGASFTDSAATDSYGVANDTTYYYVVRAVNAGGESGNSNEASATPEAPPAAVTDLSATAGNASVTLNWSAVVHATSYTIARGTVTGGPYTPIQTLTVDPSTAVGDAVMFVDGGADVQNDDGTVGLVNGTTYYYVVTGSDVGGTSPNSNQATATPQLPLPSQPDALRAQSGDTAVSLIWSESDNATTYDLYRAVDGAASSFLVSVPISQTEYTDAGLTNGHTYAYYVVGRNDAGVSTASPTASAIPAATHLTTAQAILIAQIFCQAIGQPVTATASATFPVPMPSASSQDGYWLSRWSIEFPGQAQVDVVDSTGNVSWYYNYTISAMDGDVGPAEPSTTALQSFSTVISASGLSSAELGSATATEQQTTVPADRVGHEWQVEASRVYNGTIYLDQDAEVDIQAETGQIHAFMLHFSAPSPTANSQTVTGTQASTLSDGILTNAGITTATLENTILTVVEPNTMFQPGGTATPIPGASYVAWDCGYYDGTTGIYYDVWIDAGSGTALGGRTLIVSGLRPSLKKLLLKSNTHHGTSDTAHIVEAINQAPRHHQLKPGKQIKATNPARSTKPVTKHERRRHVSR